MAEAFICDAVRTPIGRYGGALSGVRTDDLAAIPIRTLVERNASIDWSRVDDVIFGCANQAGRTIQCCPHRRCWPGCRSRERRHRQPPVRLRDGGGGAGGAGGKDRRGQPGDRGRRGVHVARAFVMPKATSAFSRKAEIYDTTIGWRFVNPLMKKAYGVDSMPETSDNVAADFEVSRADQDAFAYRSQMRAKRAQAAGRFAEEIVPVKMPGGAKPSR